MLYIRTPAEEESCERRPAGVTGRRTSSRNGQLLGDILTQRSRRQSRPRRRWASSTTDLEDLHLCARSATAGDALGLCNEETSESADLETKLAHNSRRRQKLSKARHARTRSGDRAVKSTSTSTIEILISVMNR